MVDEPEPSRKSTLNTFMLVPRILIAITAGGASWILFAHTDLITAALFGGALGRDWAGFYPFQTGYLPLVPLILMAWPGRYAINWSVGPIATLFVLAFQIWFEAQVTSTTPNSPLDVLFLIGRSAITLLFAMAVLVGMALLERKDPSRGHLILASASTLALVVSALAGAVWWEQALWAALASGFGFWSFAIRRRTSRSNRKDAVHN